MINNTWLIFGGLGITAIVAVALGNRMHGSSYSSSAQGFGTSADKGFGSSSPSYGSIASSGLGMPGLESGNSNSYGQDYGQNTGAGSYGSGGMDMSQQYGGRRTKRKRRKTGTKRGKK